MLINPAPLKLKKETPSFIGCPVGIIFLIIEAVIFFLRCALRITIF